MSLGGGDAGVSVHTHTHVWSCALWIWVHVIPHVCMFYTLILGVRVSQTGSLSLPLQAISCSSATVTSSTRVSLLKIMWALTSKERALQTSGGKRRLFVRLNIELRSCHWVTDSGSLNNLHQCVTAFLHPLVY